VLLLPLRLLVLRPEQGPQLRALQRLEPEQLRLVQAQQQLAPERLLLVV
jgi:hypothetical protein